MFRGFKVSEGKDRFEERIEIGVLPRGRPIHHNADP